MQQLLVDVGAILRTIEKSDDFEIPEISRYLQLYRKFSDLISVVIKDMMCDDLDVDKVNGTISRLGAIEEIKDSVYDDLVMDL